MVVFWRTFCTKSQLKMLVIKEIFYVPVQHNMHEWKSNITEYNRMNITEKNSLKDFTIFIKNFYLAKKKKIEISEFIHFFKLYTLKPHIVYLYNYTFIKDIY